MSALHRLAQEIIQEECKVMLPAYAKQYVKKSARLITFDEVTLEETFKDEVSRRRPDCVGKVLSEGIEIWVEIYCTNPINKERRDDIIRLQKYCIEIDFSDLLNTDYTRESIRERLLKSFDDREWICHPIWDKEEAEKEEEDRIRREKEQRRLEAEEQRHEEERRRRIEEGLRQMAIRTVKVQTQETPTPSFTWSAPTREETYSGERHEQKQQLQDWLQDVKYIQLDTKGREGFYEMIRKDYAKVTFANSHKFVIEHAHEKMDQLMKVINTNPDLLQPETKVYLEYLLVLWVLENLNKRSEFGLGKRFVEEQVLRNSILQAIKQIGHVNIKRTEQSLTDLSAIKGTEDKETAMQILKICYIN